MQAQNAPVQVPEEFIGVYGLGVPVDVYPATAWNRWVSAIMGVLLLGGAGLVGIYGLYDSYVQVSKYGSVMLSETIAVPLIIAGFLFLFGIWAVVNAYQSWNKSIVVYEKGLAYSDNKGVQTWGWHEIEWFFVSITKHYHNGIYTGTTYLYTLQKTDGSKLRLDNKFKKIQMLGQLVGQKVAPLQYDKLLQKLRNGQTVVLGPVAINKDNITIGKKCYLWSEVEQVGIQKGYVSIKKKGGGWFSGATSPVSAIPNLDALFAVVNQIVKVKAG